MLNHTGGTSSHGGMLDSSKIPISALNLGNFLDSMEFQSGKSTSELRFVCEQPILRSPRSGSKKLRLLNQLTNL